MIDQKKLALIHIVKKELQLTDGEYREILYAAAGVESAKDLTNESFRALMNYFVRSKHYTRNGYGLTIKQKLYVEYLVKTLGWSDAHFAHFLNKYHRKANLEWLSKKEASQVIQALKRMVEQKNTQS